MKKGQNRLKERKDPRRDSLGLTLQQSQSPAPDPELLNTVFRSQARSAAMLDVSAGGGGEMVGVGGKTTRVGSFTRLLCTHRHGVQRSSAWF